MPVPTWLPTRQPSSSGTWRERCTWHLAFSTTALVTPTARHGSEWQEWRWEEYDLRAVADRQCSQGGNHLDRGSQYVLHLANVNGGTFPSAQTVDFIGNTSHQDFAMMSADPSLNWLFVNDYNTSYPDIVASNPGDGVPKVTPTHAPRPKAYATHGNTALASSLLGGSIILVVCFFSTLPLLFRANYSEEEAESVGTGTSSKLAYSTLSLRTDWR